MKTISVAQIRERFPMYGDVSDENLVLAVRRKFYSDIPLKQFLTAVEFEAPDPTEGMSGTDKLLAGIGKGMTDVGRGVGQAFGAVSRGDVKAARKRDSALMNTGAGLTGNVVGNVAAMLPAALIPGAATIPGAAAIGGATGALAPSESTDETFKNIGMGGVLGPASILAGRALGSVAKGGKALLEPFTKSGQERIAARTLQQFATDPKKAVASIRSSRALVPGSAPTLAQAADDPGLAQLERTLQNNPETGGKLATRYSDQRAARMQAVQDVAGQQSYYDEIKAGRDLFAREDYAKAMSSGIDGDMADAIKPQIESLMRRPSIQQAKGVAKKLAAEQDINLSDFGSIEGLDYLKKALDNQITKAMTPGNAIGDAQLRSLLQTKGDLMKVLDDIAPAYKQANDNYAAMSRQVNSMDVARDLQKSMEPALARYGASTRELGQNYASALEKATASVKKQTGQHKSLSDVMPTNDIATLEGVARDMARKAKADDMGMARGSNTAQNLSAQNLLRRTLGPTGLPQSWAESSLLQGILSPYTGVAKLAGAEQRVMDELAGAALDPQEAMRLLLMASQPSRVDAAGRLMAPYLPLLPLSGLFAPPSQQ